MIFCEREKKRSRISSNAIIRILFYIEYIDWLMIGSHAVKYGILFVVRNSIAFEKRKQISTIRIDCGKFGDSDDDA